MNLFNRLNQPPGVWQIRASRVREGVSAGGYVLAEYRDEVEANTHCDRLNAICTDTVYTVHFVGPKA